MIDTELKIDTLSNLCIDMHQGINTVTEKIEYLESGVPILQSKHITKGYLNIEDTKYVSEKDYEKYRKKYQAKINDVLVCNIGTIGKSLVIRKEENFLIAWNLFLIKLDKNKLDSNYFQHYLNYLSQKKYFDKFLTGGTVKFINKKTMGNIPIPLPPIETQKRIAQILDNAAVLREKTHQLIKEYDALTKSVFLDMFGDTHLNTKNWQIDKLENICSEIVDCPHSTPNYVNIKTEYPCIRTTELRNGSIDWRSMKYLDKEGYELRNKRLKPKAGDIVYGREGTIGEAVIIPQNTNFSLGQRVMLFRANNLKVNSVFLHNVIRSKGLLFQAFRANTGSTVSHVNVKDVKKFRIILPSVALQNQFAEKITLIEQQKELAKQELKESEHLFNCLLQKAFKGELT